MAHATDIIGWYVECTPFCPDCVPEPSPVRQRLRAERKEAAQQLRAARAGRRTDPERARALQRVSDGIFERLRLADIDSRNEERAPIFESSETDSPSHCDACGELIAEGLTSDGVRYVADAIREAREEYCGGGRCACASKEPKARGCRQCAANGAWRERYGTGIYSGPLSDESTAPLGALGTLGAAGATILRALRAVADEARKRETFARAEERRACARAGLGYQSDLEFVAALESARGAAAALEQLAQLARDVRSEAGIPG